MEIGEIVSDSVKYPTSDWTKIIILAVILIIPIVNFIGIGYVIRIIKGTLASLDDLPDFDEVGELFIDGLKVFVVGIVYALSLIHISEPTRLLSISYAVFCLKKKNTLKTKSTYSPSILHNQYT